VSAVKLLNVKNKNFNIKGHWLKLKRGEKNTGRLTERKEQLAGRKLPS